MSEAVFPAHACAAVAMNSSNLPNSPKMKTYNYYIIYYIRSVLLAYWASLLLRNIFLRPPPTLV